MCVGLPARVKNIKDGMAEVDFGGVSREVSVELIENIKPGDYVMIHAGIAIARITTEEAEETLSVLEELYGTPKDASQ